MLLILSLVALAAFCWDCRQAVKAHHYREIVTGGFFFAIGVVLVAAQARKWPIPNPVDAITYLFTPVSQTVARLLS